MPIRNRRGSLTASGTWRFRIEQMSKAKARLNGEPLGMTQMVIDGLRDQIVSGELEPGTPLSRRRIAERFGCSYTPVVEALIRLEYAGLVEAGRNQTARVSTFSLERIHNDYVLREAYETQGDLPSR